ncbi:unnamed protein product, partial [Closterium sp. NIES-54]
SLTSTASATASTASTAATNDPTPRTTPTTISTSSTASSTSPSTTLASLAFARAASPTGGRRSADLLSANEVDSSSRGNRGEKGDRGTPLKEGGATVTARSTNSYSLFSAAARRSSTKSTVSLVGQRERKWSLSEERESGRRVTR